MSASRSWPSLLLAGVLLAACGGSFGKENGTVQVTMNGDGTFTATGPPGRCLQFANEGGGAVGDAFAIDDSGSVTADIPDGAHGWSDDPCPPDEPEANGGGGAHADAGVAPIASRMPGSPGWFTTTGGVFGDFTLHSMYELEVLATSPQSARSAGSILAAALAVSPLVPPGPPELPPSARLRSFVATQLDLEAALGVEGEGMVFSLSEEPLSSWRVRLDGVDQPSAPAVQLPSGLWMSSAPIAYADLELAPGEQVEVRADFTTAEGETGFVVDRYTVPDSSPP